MSFRFPSLLEILVIVALALCASFASAPSPARAQGRTRRIRAASDYYVSPQGKDTADGSAAHPWATLTHAAANVRPGVTVHVAPGVYRTAVVTKISGSPDARIRFVAEPKWGARLVTSGEKVSWYNYGDDVDIVGFDITGDGNIGIASEASGVRIVGNHVHDIAVPNNGCDEGGAGIDHAGYSTTDNDTIGNVVDHIGVNNPQSCAHGIYHSTSGGHVQNNIVNNVRGCGIHTWHAATHVMIANNLVFRALGPHSCGLLIGAGDAPGGVTNDYSIVANNLVLYSDDKNGGGYGIEEFGQTGPHNLYANNLLYANTVAVRLQHGLSARGTIQADPGLTKYASDGAGDYRLRPESPALGAGTFMGAPKDDIDGVPRPEARIDLGPYQSGGNLSTSAAPAITTPSRPIGGHQ